MTELVVRMVMSLCIVLGLLLLAARVAGKRYRAHTGSTVKVLQRQALSRGTTVTVVSVGNRVLVLGTTEQQVRVLTELDPSEVLSPEDTQAGAEPGRLYALPTAAPSAPSAIAPRAALSPDFAQVLLDAQEAAAPLPQAGTPGRHAARHRAGTTHPATTSDARASGALAGSLLSLQTWRQALQALSGRAS